ncbi:MAG: hypothetical protein SGILL_002862 [Bacillariaceae sp.]
MIEELQRSVIFFSRANGTLKQQNDDLTRLLMQAQNQVSIIESGGKPEAAAAPVEGKKESAAGDAPAPTSAAAAAMAGTLPPMQPGATMQAMANFQQAAAAAMQDAVNGMKGIPGVNVQTLASPASGSAAASNLQDTMTALAMQKAAVLAQSHTPAPAPVAPPAPTQEVEI